MNVTCANWTAPNNSLWLEPTQMLFMLCPAALVVICTIFGNILVLKARTNVGGGQRQTQVFIVNLAVADLLVGVLVLPLSLVNMSTRYWPLGRTLCRLWVFADIVFCTASIVSICIISIDRYMAVSRPLKYKAVISKGKCYMAVAVVWSVAISVLLTSVRWNPVECVDPYICFVGNEVRYLTHSVVFAFFLPAAVTITLYAKIYRISRDRQRAIDSGFMMVFGRNMNFLTSGVTAKEPANQDNAMRIHCGPTRSHQGEHDIVAQQRHVLKMHRKTAKTLGLVSSAFLFCWLPFFTLYMINFQCECIDGSMLDVSTWLGYCNSALNPIIYAFTVKEFKQYLSLLLRPWRFCAEQDVDTVNLKRLRQQYAIQNMSPAKMARLLAGYIDDQPAQTANGGQHTTRQFGHDNRRRQRNIDWYEPSAKKSTVTQPLALDAEGEDDDEEHLLVVRTEPILDNTTGGSGTDTGHSVNQQYSLTLHITSIETLL